MGVQLVHRPISMVSGSKTALASGVYGMLGVAAATNVPGSATDNALSWTDKSGNFWIFGGSGYNAGAESKAISSDLWEFSPSSKEWTWMGGSGT